MSWTEIVVDALINMSWVEIIANIFCLICVALTVKKNIWCWPTGIIGVSAYFVLFYQYKLYGDMGLQVVFLFQSIYGWWFWLNGKKEDIEEVPIRTLSNPERGSILGIILLIWGSLYYVLHSYTDAAIPHLDALVTALSLIANLLLARKVLENWILWIIADVFFVGIFIYKGLYLSAVTYVIFLVMATSGWINWKKDWELQKA